MPTRTTAKSSRWFLVTGCSDHVDDPDESLAEFLATELDSDADATGREADVVDPPPPWGGEITDPADERSG